MKILLVNGSPNQHGCTYTALSEAAKTISENGIETEFFWIGKKAIPGCIACYKCAEKKRCVFDDIVNEFTEKAQNADGFIFGSPVYYAGMNGSMMSFMDRVFFSASRKEPHPFMLKPAAAVVSARRAGTTAALDSMNKYFLHGQMLVVGSRYWNMVHGNTPEEVKQDEEGMQVMRVLGRNMAWVLKLKEAGEKMNIPLPKQEDIRIATNFIR
ncbi:MAG: flavodoxin family protein [Clostridia bacterium]|nr:flavodoxin family protein [Clostridia bacterium]MBQ3464176.1 flavodoxin family protein [Clostridia bacterium]